MLGLYVCFGVDGKEPGFERFNFYLSYGFGGGHELTVDVGFAHGVGVDKGDVAYACAYEAFGAPTSYAAYAKHNDAFGGQYFHGGSA